MKGAGRWLAFPLALAFMVPYRRGRTAAPSRRTPHGSLVEALGAVDSNASAAPHAASDAFASVHHTYAYLSL